MHKLLWEPNPAQIEQSNMYRFMQYVNQRHDKAFGRYDELYQWSIEAIPEFWAAIWNFMAIRASQPGERVVDDLALMPGARWFEGARLNFAENLLRYRDDRPALVFKGEDRPVRRMSYAELYQEVARVAAALRACGIRAG
ncbi:MAG: acetyl-coenzyme A synthetase N-terminal domain-containing protein, partial [Desulfobacterales bacterium]|nr:acetyl-coenzyme A synthetase N-terminal domain-containing protein [Desulfobacterales bacterium]